MNFGVATLARRSLRYYAASHIGTLLGAAVAGAVLVGALAVGDSVRGTLRDMALARVGRANDALAGGDHFFRDALASNFPGSSSALMLPGTAATPDNAARANQVQILGIDPAFHTLAQNPEGLLFSKPDSVWLNMALAAQLRAKVGDTIILHVQKPSLFSREAPLSPQEDIATGMRLTVAGIASDAQFGRFSLQASQIPPLNAFLSLAFLQEKTEFSGRANLLLTAAPTDAQALRQGWRLGDAGLELREINGVWELRTDRVFLDAEVVAAAASIAPRQQYLTYFVNELRAGTNSTPYSMVTAASNGLRDDEIQINQWLAEDLAAKVGDEIRLSYYVLGSAHRLETREAAFRVQSIAPIADRSLMPDFPGIAKAEKTENWDAGFAIDMRKIRPRDEQYWKDYRGTPKAFISLAAGQRLWGNRFGNVTSIRFPTNAIAKDALEAKLLTSLDPAKLGLNFQPIRQQALAASAQGQDFGELFLYFSFFLIASALILLALLFQLNLEKRAPEIGTLLALGWPPSLVRRVLLFEGLGIALVGSVLGTLGGVGYAKGILWGLRTVWSSAVAGSELQFHVTGQSLGIGLCSGIVVSTVVLRLALRAQCKRPARELLERGHELESYEPGRRWAGWLALGCALAGGGWIGSALAGRHLDVETFFGGGTFLLIGGLAALAVLYRPKSGKTRDLTLMELGWRGCSRRPKRSLATASLLACGSFLIVAVGAYKLDAGHDAGRASGTGGFALIGRSSLPVVQDLNTPAGREFFGLDGGAMDGVDVVAIRVHDGDDASCLNLNAPRSPRLLGVEAAALQQRGAFTFAKPGNALQPWKLLEQTNAAEVPGVADDTVLEYILHKRVGDTLEYVDAHGRPFHVRLVGALANSILQGNVVIEAAAFLRLFPDETGYREFLIDAPAAKTAQVSAALTRALQDRGLELTPAASRLDAFNAVQNTYLDTFQILGGLGLLLGSAGLGVVVLRNVAERRAEFAILTAVGFRRRTLRGLVVREHAVLLYGGLIAGTVSALATLLPALLLPGARVSYGTVAVTLAAVYASGLGWAWLAARWAMRGELLPALRNE